jgi:hypothetical protein
MASVADLVEEPGFRELTDAETFQAGADLADSGAVTFDEFGPLRVRARVEDGDAVYAVDLRSGLGKLTWSCSEPGGARVALCRHLVAAGLQTWRGAPPQAEGTGVDAAGAAGEEPATEWEPAPAGEGEPLSASAEAPGPPPTERDAPGAARVAATARTAPSAADRAAAISGVHAILYTPAADEVRRFLADVLGLSSVDAGGGWPIFALPPAELAVHPDAAPRHELWLRCDDLEATLRAIESRGISVRRPVRDEAWGRVSAIQLPGGLDLPIYEPRHPSPLSGA